MYDRLENLMARLALSAAGALLCTGCVSVNLPMGKIARAHDVVLVEPTTPFARLTTGAVDRAWQNQKNGNTIGYLSECGSADDLDLKGLENEALSALSNMKIVSHAEATFNEREGLRSTVEGQVDGVAVKMSLVIFKKNGCSFTLSYVGRSSAFSGNEKDFAQFVERFQVP